MPLGPSADMMRAVGAKDGTSLILSPSPAGLAEIIKAVSDGFIPGLPTAAPDIKTMARGEAGVTAAPAPG